MTTLTPTVAPAARGVLHATIPAGVNKPAALVFSLPGSSYQLHLRPTPSMEAVQAAPGGRLVGTIATQARRIDVVTHGGRFVEPLVGRPRRVQGTVLAVDSAANTVTVNAGGAVAVDGLPLPIVLKIGDVRQRADQFAIGSLVACDVLDGATFQPIR